jgi:NADP-reducing hydrogenase subunit HndB
MPKLTIEDLKAIQEKVKQQKILRDGVSNSRIIIHMGTCGIAAGARDVMKALLDEIQQKDVKDVIVTTSGCAGLCSKEPMATVEIAGKPPVKYINLNGEKIRRILNDHAIGGKILTEFALGVGSETTH